MKIIYNEDIDFVTVVTFNRCQIIIDNLGLLIDSTQSMRRSSNFKVIAYVFLTDYIQYNPVKHGLINNPFYWKYSSTHEYKDIYQADWGNKTIDYGDEFGE